MDLCCRRTSNDQGTTAQLSSTGLRAYCTHEALGRSLYVPFCGASPGSGATRAVNKCKAWVTRAADAAQRSLRHSAEKL
eukprot:1377768-Prymnesium_polylepis.1